MNNTEPWQLPGYEALLNKIKQRESWGTMRPELCEIIGPEGQRSSSLRLQWRRHAGKIETDLMEITDEEEKTIITNLIENGIVVPTTQEDFYDTFNIRNYQHFDDVNWAKNDKGEIIIYRLSQNPYYPDIADEVIPTTSRHLKAIEHLEHLLHMGNTMEDDPITLKSGEIITPIITWRELVALRQRQKGIFPTDFLDSPHRQDKPQLT